MNIELFSAENIDSFAYIGGNWKKLIGIIRNYETKKCIGYGLTEETALKSVELAEKGKPTIVKEYLKGYGYMYFCCVKYNQTPRQTGYGETPIEAYNNWKEKYERKNSRI